MDIKKHGLPAVAECRASMNDVGYIKFWKLK